MTLICLASKLYNIIIKWALKFTVTLIFIIIVLFYSKFLFLILCFSTNFYNSKISSRSNPTIMNIIFYDKSILKINKPETIYFILSLPRT